MKNFFKLAFMVFALSLGSALLTRVKAQAVTVPWSNGIETYSPMWNTSNVYRNPASISNVGTLLDSVPHTTSIKLQTAKFTFGRYLKTNADTVIPANLLGAGDITFTWEALHCGSASTLSTVVCTLYGSLNGQDYVPVPGVATQTLTATSATVSVQNTMHVSTKDFLYYYGLVSASVDTASVRMQYLFKKTSQIMLPPPR